MSDLPRAVEATPASPPPAPASPPPLQVPAPRQRRPWLTILLIALIAAAALALAWLGQQRVQALEQELVKRQDASAEQAAEARLLARQAQEWSQDAVARITLLEARVAEVTVQRSQLEELIQSLARSRDDNLLIDMEAGLRAAIQQSAITGSAEPLVAALKAADERLARAEAVRLEPVRRAITRDLDRLQSADVADVPALAARLDEALRLADEAPLMVVDSVRGVLRPDLAASAPGATTDAPATPGWLPTALLGWWSDLWGEARGLLRVARIDRPEAMLLAPEQSYFLRENLKLRLLNARLALLSRQFDLARRDVQDALAAVERYYDPGAQRSVALAELLRSVIAQSRTAGVSRPDDTLAALHTAAAGR